MDKWLRICNEVGRITGELVLKNPERKDVSRLNRSIRHGSPEQRDRATFFVLISFCGLQAQART